MGLSAEGSKALNAKTPVPAKSSHCRQHGPNAAGTVAFLWTPWLSFMCLLRLWVQSVRLYGLRAMSFRDSGLRVGGGGVWLEIVRNRIVGIAFSGSCSKLTI